MTIQKQINDFFNLSMIKWSDQDKICFYAYCLGVLRSKIDLIELELIEKQFKYYAEKNNV